MFVTHEPCIMCAMALLHSRVKEVIYLQPSPGTGGCGGSVCVPGLEAVNHRYDILRWKTDSDGLWKKWWDEESLHIDTDVDV
jgi:tRNA-specific adenosine deaminase 3